MRVRTTGGVHRRVLWTIAAMALGAPAGASAQTGACCLGDFCSPTTRAMCEQIHGVYLGDGTSCATGGGCPGACCLPNGTCIITGSQDCTLRCGVFRGAGTTCPANCAPLPTGACCDSIVGCLGVMTQCDCMFTSGSYRGDGTTCADCGTGACCLSGGGCQQQNAAICAALGGVFRGLGTVCSACQNRCYPNCDNSTAPPILNVNDFICFQTKYAAGDSYANCDGSTTAPVLNVNDFICFQTRYAQGCL